jgi:hypothetical protein
MTTANTGQRKVLTVEEFRVQKLRGKIGRNALYLAIERNEVPHVRIGKKIFIFDDALEQMRGAFLEGQQRER